MNKRSTTGSVDVIADGGLVEITGILKSGKLKLKKGVVFLTIHKDYTHDASLSTWDNERWIKGLGKTLKNNKKNKYTKALKEDCKEFDLDFKTIKEEVLICYKEAKKLGMFKGVK